MKIGHLIFKVSRGINGTNVLTKFHEDRTINVASRVFTRQNVDDGRRTTDKRQSQKLTMNTLCSVTTFIEKECVWSKYNISIQRESQFVDSYALLKMGDYYWYGCQGNRDIHRAADMYAQAAVKNNPQALFNLAFMVEEGVDIPTATLRYIRVPLRLQDNNATLLTFLYTNSSAALADVTLVTHYSSSVALAETITIVTHYSSSAALAETITIVTHYSSSAALAEVSWAIVTHYSSSVALADGMDHLLLLHMARTIVTHYTSSDALADVTIVTHYSSSAALAEMAWTIWIIVTHYSSSVAVAGVVDHFDQYSSSAALEVTIMSRTIVTHYSSSVALADGVDHLLLFQMLWTIVAHYSFSAALAGVVDHCDSLYSSTIVTHYSSSNIVTQYSSSTIVTHYSSSVALADVTIVTHYSSSTIVTHYSSSVALVSRTIVTPYSSSAALAGAVSRLTRRPTCHVL
ncbi:hypothetical protein DPMN_031696 [Dreissena polymorpha]|uniref:Uncharacterized protein n=1 Tax=Dreissena polymorpha TaxID=45954 RepID=A0A9D4RJC4_DREPO|nr:hypothetical protein DPMN_031696 [Dreissena polymorpha]